MKLYFTPGACSLVPHILLEELGLAFELEQVDLKTKTTKSGADFSAINSKGYVPALVLDNGHVLTEVSVLAQYLSDLKPEAGLIPAAGEARYQLLSLLVYISTEIHKPMGSLFNPNASDDARAAAQTLLTRRLNWIAAELAGKPYLTGDSYTAADAYLFTVLGWARLVNFDLSPWPTLQALCGKVAERPAVQRAMKAEGLI
ncbi:glutathione transferase GstA [Shewanella yunxiaonensis]|uniref:Glutathione transferase GstA n=1 Tax=Shewanella yunxiaonensis TaxID=2829809 RepID=A0ABX7YY56_9GAMM|nr:MULTISPECIES: glutathione transferase GstA [Shewanella]MDF0534334.1 glutathione transferase GstA [Shewanella sp. A32]QUN07116.1 glutathione transferase GstA [Shewanella yunxiaonensis]